MIPGRWSNFWYTVRPLLLIFLLMWGSFRVNEAVIRFRMDEFNRAMVSISQRYNSSHSLNMLARFELIRKRQEMKEEADEAALEMRLQSLSNRSLLDTTAKAPPGLQEKALRLVIRGVRWVLGKPPISYEVPKSARGDIELAYVYERSRKYEAAIRIYAGVLDTGGVDGSTTLTLLLHRGFCYGLLGEYDRAEKDFQRVVVLDQMGEDAEVARRFLEILRGFRAQVAKAKQEDLGSLATARRLFLLANYTGAMEALAAVLNRPGITAGEQWEGWYLYGRSQEEIGHDSDAVITYRNLIREAPGSAYAKKANRRLFLLGKLYTRDEDLEKEAIKKLEQYEDRGFLNRFRDFTVAAPPPPPETVRENRLASLGGAGLTALKIGGLESIPEPEAVEPVRPVAAEKAEKATGSRIEERKGRQANLKKLKADPMRRESILQTITNNRGELQFVYQRWLRKGKPFQGEAAIRLVIGPEGDVREASLDRGRTTLDHPGFLEDILKNVRRWKFRADPGAGGDLPVTFPVKFVNRD